VGRAIDFRGRIRAEVLKRIESHWSEPRQTFRDMPTYVGVTYLAINVFQERDTRDRAERQNGANARVPTSPSNDAADLQGTIKRK